MSQSNPLSHEDFKRPWQTLLPFICYWFILFGFGVLKTIHFAIPAIFLALYYPNRNTRRLSLFLLPVLATLMVYESMGYIAHIISAGTNVAEPYLIEEWFFAWSVPAPFKIWAEYWQEYTFATLDFICGIAYLIYVFVFYAFALFLYFHPRLKPWAQPTATSFFIVSMMGYLTYYLYPAAPPWYVEEFGMGPALMDTPPSAAGALRFDTLVGSPVMEKLYANGAIVFGSIPSLHAAYPFLIVPVAFMVGRFRGSAIAFFLLVCFSAVYLNHHYIIDLVLGALYAWVAVWISFRLHGPVAQLDRASVS